MPKLTKEQLATLEANRREEQAATERDDLIAAHVQLAEQYRHEHHIFARLAA